MALASRSISLLLILITLGLAACEGVDSTANNSICTGMPVHGKRALVVVLGDFGRSPRMQYHSVSLAQQVSFRPRALQAYER